MNVKMISTSSTNKLTLHVFQQGWFRSVALVTIVSHLLTCHVIRREAISCICGDAYICGKNISVGYYFSSDVTVTLDKCSL